MPPDTGVTANARGSVHRSTSIGPGEAAAPLGMATTTVRPSRGPSPAWLKCAIPAAMPACWHERVDPAGPAKQAARVTGAGALTDTLAWSMGTFHWFPTAFQYSSS